MGLPHDGLLRSQYIRKQLAMDGLGSGLMFEAATSSAVMKPTIDAPQNAPQLWRDDGDWGEEQLLLLLRIITV